MDLAPLPELIIDELRELRRRGGSCLVDLTNGGLGRDPAWLRSLALQTGLHVVMGSGWYRQRFYPPESNIDRRSADDLADELEHEFAQGVGSSGVRPGMIGEIGTDGAWLTAQEERVHRAVARAAARTGLAVSTHSYHGRVALAQLRIFEEERLDPGRVVIGHADANPDLDYHLAILERGASLQFDLLGASADPVAAAREPRLVQIIVELLERGFADRMLLSQDVSSNARLKAHGGTGYTYIVQHFLPALRTAAVGEGEIRQMTVDNPRRLLTVTT
jgi:phosphotriesterase-related protein